MRKAVVAGMALAMLLCGCTGGEHGREPENTVLAQVFGVDRMGGRCLLTAAGPNGKGETVIQSSEGESFAEAFAALPGSGKEWMSVKNVTHLARLPHSRWRRAPRSRWMRRSFSSDWTRCHP